ncbi:MAG: hypothetical protein NTW52_16825 [Planctomycetota bacterium]|nr:hypothetical protein [Planctomycetota bacterium]
MIRIACFVLLTLSLISPIGCALCSSPFDLDFVTYGGKTPRTDMRHGRVGSNLSDPQLVGYATNGPGTSEPMEIQAIETEYGSVMESSTGNYQQNNYDQTVVETDESILLEQREPAAFKPKSKSRIIQVPSGDSFFDDVP